MLSTRFLEPSWTERDLPDHYEKRPYESIATEEDIVMVPVSQMSGRQPWEQAFPEDLGNQGVFDLYRGPWSVSPNPAGDLQHRLEQADCKGGRRK